MSDQTLIDDAHARKDEMLAVFAKAALNLRTTGERVSDDLLADAFDSWAFIVKFDPDMINRVGGPETLACARAVIEDLALRLGSATGTRDG